MELSALFRFDQCRALDADSIAAGIPEQQLMGQAALASLYVLEAAGALTPGGRVFILCGPGNNGGDGYALACMLAGRVAARDIPQITAGGTGVDVRLFTIAPPKSPAAQFYAQLAEGLARQSDASSDRNQNGRTSLSLHSYEDFLRISSEQFNTSDTIVEALLGTGQTAAPRGAIAKILEHLRELRPDARPHLVSLDLPVGLREDARGENDTRLVPDEIHSYGVDKAALRLDPEIAAHSRVRVLPMGFVPLDPPEAAGLDSAKTTGERAPIRSLEFAAAAPDRLRTLTAKDPLSHKYQAGHGLLLGGSPGMEGALLMAARAFFASGGGILHAVVPDAESRHFLTGTLPGVMFLDHDRPLPDNLRPRAIAAGPGLAPADLEAGIRLLEPLLASDDFEATLILDAGALPFVNDARFPERLRGRTLLTPHTGEWKRLGGPKVDCVHALDAALDFHLGESGPRTFALIKDAISILFGPGSGNAIGVRHRPNPALAVAGSGDNLCGILLALFARRGTVSSSTAADGTPAFFERIAAALEILDLAARQAHHPRADQFPELIRRALAAAHGSDPDETSDRSRPGNREAQQL